MTEPLMTPEQRLAALEKLEAAQGRNQRRAARAAWGSVAIAAVVLAALIGFATWSLSSLNRQRNGLEQQISSLQSKKEATEKELESAKQQRRAAVLAFSSVPEASRETAIDQQFATAPELAASLPRIYLHIVDRSDRPRAEMVDQVLANAGYVVVGIQYAPQGRGLAGTDVRFYHESEKNEATKIVKILQQAGETDATLNDRTNDSASARVRPNHFEVWLAHRGAA